MKILENYLFEVFQWKEELLISNHPIIPFIWLTTFNLDIGVITQNYRVVTQIRVITD